MKRKTSFVKALAVFISILMLLTSLPLSVLAAVDLDASALPSDTYLISKTDYQIAPGIEETQFLINESECRFCRHR